MTATPFAGTVRAYKVPVAGYANGKPVPMLGRDGKVVKSEPYDLNFTASDVAGAMVIFTDIGAAVTQVTDAGFLWVEDILLSAAGVDTTKIQWRKSQADLPKVHRDSLLANTTTSKESRSFCRPLHRTA